MINVENLKEIIMRLPKRKGTEEGITSDIKSVLNKRGIC